MFPTILKAVFVNIYNMSSSKYFTIEGFKDPPSISKLRVQKDFSTGYQLWSLKLASPNFLSKLEVTHMSKMGIFCFLKNHVYFCIGFIFGL